MGGSSATPDAAVYTCLKTSDDGLIADFTTDNSLNPVDGRQGGFYVYGDGSGTFDPPMVVCESYPIDTSVGNPTCSGPGSFHTKATGFAKWGAAMGVDFAPALGASTGSGGTTTAADGGGAGGESGSGGSSANSGTGGSGGAGSGTGGSTTAGSGSGGSSSGGSSASGGNGSAGSSASGGSGSGGSGSGGSSSGGSGAGGESGNGGSSTTGGDSGTGGGSGGSSTVCAALTDAAPTIKGNYDASKYIGVSFWAKSAAPLTGVQVSFPDIYTDGAADPTLVDPNASRCAYVSGSTINCSPYLVKFGDAAFPAYKDYQIDTMWKRFDVYFADTKQDQYNVGAQGPDNALSVQHLTAMAIQVNAIYVNGSPTANDFELWVDDINFIPATGGTGGSGGTAGSSGAGGSSGTGGMAETGGAGGAGETGGASGQGGAGQTGGMSGSGGASGTAGAGAGGTSGTGGQGAGGASGTGGAAGQGAGGASGTGGSSSGGT